MAQGSRDAKGRSRGKRGAGQEAVAAIDLKSLKRDAFHLLDLDGIPHAIRWTSDDVIEFYEVVEP